MAADPAEVQPAATAQECAMNARLDLFCHSVAARLGRHIVPAAKVLAGWTRPAL